MRATNLESWRRVAASAALSLTVILAPGAFGAAPAAAQESLVFERPLPGPVVPPPFHRAAVERGTRSSDGSPGLEYWRNSARYEIDAALDPDSRRITGSGRIVYHNRAPDALNVLGLHLHQNLHAEGAMRNEPQEVTGGVELGRVSLNGRTLEERPLDQGPGYQTQATLMVVRPPEPVASGDSVTLEVEWAFTVPQASSGRMGYSQDEVYFIAYWFPKMGVYDDLRGWDLEPYLGNAEFYDEFGDYRVRLTVPAGWTVMATGDLVNPDEVLTERTRSRLAEAAGSDEIVHVATGADRREGRVTASPGPEGTLTYEFEAEEVRDFAWTASDVQVWDATSAVVPDRDGDGASDRIMIHSFWREDRAPLWEEQAVYGKHSIEFHSRYTGVSYPWPHMTSVEGADIIGGGMEFPMMTVMGSYEGRGADALYNVTSHEIAHMWVPMIVGTNEKRHAWMDEGFTTFLENQSRPDFRPGEDADAEDRMSYLQGARAGLEQPLMRHGDYYEPGPGYGIASYPKQATLLVTLRALLGEDVFMEAYRTYLSEWSFKHPAPWDYFNTFERVAGRDLDWFWQAFYYETWTLDQAVVGVEERDGAPVVIVEDRGWAPMPVRLRIETTEGGTLEREIPVREWLDGDVRVRLELPASVGRVTRVEIDPSGAFPDVDRSDNVWTADPAGGR